MVHGRGRLLAVCSCEFEYFPITRPDCQDSTLKIYCSHGCIVLWHSAGDARKQLNLWLCNSTNLQCVCLTTELHLSSKIDITYYYKMADYCRPPELKTHSAASLVLAVFPFREVKERSVKQLPSYEDRNYYCRGTLDGELVGKGTTGDQGGPGTINEFLLKLSNSSLPLGLIEGINAVTNYLKSKDFSRHTL